MAPNKLLETIHSRMPAILTRENENLWLETTNNINEVYKLLKPFEGVELIIDKVSNLVNNPASDSEKLIN